MAEAPYGTVTEIEYPALRQLIPDLPAGFSEWEFKRYKKTVEWEASSRDNTVALVPIVVPKFREWCKRERHIPSEHALDIYAFELNSTRR